MESRSKQNIRLRVISTPVFFRELLEQMHQGKEVRMRARGWSMLPLIWDDRDVLYLVAPREGTISRGRIVLVQLGDGRYVLHRIVAIEGSRLLLRGDGNPYQEEYVHRDKVLGELVGIRRNGKLLNPNSFLWRAITLLWPQNGFIRRVILFAYRRMAVRPAERKPRRSL